MIDENIYNEDQNADKLPQEEAAPSGNFSSLDLAGTGKSHHLTGMYRNWFIDYASSVILDRSVPHITDGLKPVQRRILYSMKRLDDGRYNKVANIVGHTMQFHPHGDASIGDALVQLGQKELLIDCQGNWGNILTGDSAAAPRYIEARLSKFALETLFNNKITQWQASYDGRNQEPVALPVKFPLLLAQGVKGIAVTLSSEILPHNFNEILEAAIAYLKNEDFVLYPDFQTGGYVDISRYNDGRRGGVVKIRAKIVKSADNKTLSITEIPYGKTTGSIIDSILKANEKNKIKIKKIDDNTAANAEILVHLAPGVSSDKTIDALYAFTECEVSVSPNCCVIRDNKPCFLGVSDVLRHSVDHTMSLFRSELSIQRAELLESLMFASLEKWFIEERVYKDKGFEDSASMDDAVAHVFTRLEPFKEKLVRDVTRDDVLRLMEIKMARILKFNKDKAKDNIAAIKAQIKEIDHHLKHLVEYTITWYQHLIEKYGANYPRRTEIRVFDTIEAAKVAEATEKLYINREEGFIGTSLKKDEFVCACSNLDDIILFYKNGKYKVVKVSEKMHVGKDVLYLNVFKKNDKRTIYHAVYRDGKNGFTYIKRFAVTGVTRDKEYDLTQGKPGSKVLYFTANPNAESEVIKVLLKPAPRLKKIQFDKDFGELAIKGRQSMGNLLTKNDIHRITFKQKGVSTLGGREVWFDRDVMRLNYDHRGEFIGEYRGDDRILVITKKGEFYTTNIDLSNHFEDDILIIEKFDANKVWTAVLYDADQQNYLYIKRFALELLNKKVSFIENPASQLVLLSSTAYPRFEIVFGGNDAYREKLEVDAESFIAVKGYKARGKRVTTWQVAEVNELEPLRFPEEVEAEEISDEIEENDAFEEKSDAEILDELTGQGTLFGAEE